MEDMTPEELAAECGANLSHGCGCCYYNDDEARNRQAILFALHAAIAEEREACARVVETWWHLPEDRTEGAVSTTTEALIAAAIRSRGGA